MQGLSDSNIFPAQTNRFRSYDQPTKQCLLVAVQVATHRFGEPFKLYYFYLRGLHARAPALRAGDVADKPSLVTEPKPLNRV